MPLAFDANTAGPFRLAMTVVKRSCFNECYSPVTLNFFLGVICTSELPQSFHQKLTRVYELQYS